MLKSFRYILFPLSLIYGCIIWLRNWLYDKKILRSATFNFPLICIGNLAVGGTGKTPMAEYLIRLLDEKFKLATLSRGYKRKTKGFAIADESTSAIDIGDEPMQLHLKFHGISVAVAEERVVGIPQLLHAKPQTQVIILDDAFQHREVNAGLNILLTAHDDLYTRDFILPAGNLRDVRVSSKRAHIIVVTKCPPQMAVGEQASVVKEIRPLDFQKVFFAAIEYGKPYHLFSKAPMVIERNCNVLLVCGIAHPGPLKAYLTSQVDTYDLLLFRDHHIFHLEDLQEIKKQFSNIAAPNKMIITTEKDGVRLAKFDGELSQLPVYVLPMRHKFLGSDEEAFNRQILSFVENFVVE